MRKLGIFFLALSIIALNAAALQIEEGGIFTTLGRVFALPAIAVTIVLAFSERRMRAWSWLHWSMIAYLTWCTLTLFWTVQTDLTLFVLNRYLSSFMLVLLVWEYARTKKDINWLFISYVISGYLALAGAAYNELSGRFRYSERVTSFGTFDPNDLALAIDIGLGFAWFLATQAEQPKWVRALCGGYPIVVLGILGLTASRGGLIAAVPSFIYVLWSARKAPKWIWPIAGAAALSVVAAGLFGPLRPQFVRLSTTLLSPAQDNFNGRGDLWRFGLDIFSQHPWFGVGSGAVQELMVKYPTEHLGGQGIVVHNSFISILAESGLVGFALFATIFILAIRQFTQAPKSLRYGLLAGIASLIVGMSGATWEFRQQTWIFLALSVSAAFAYARAAIPAELRERAPLGEPSPATS